jgi:hypothetical protein
LWREAIVIVRLLWLYDAINNLSPLRVTAALDHTRNLLHLETSAHVDVEHSLNTFTSAHHLLASVVSNYYDSTPTSSSPSPYWDGCGWPDPLATGGGARCWWSST